MNFNNIEVSPITKEGILKFVSEMDIFLRYCSNFKSINKSFISELRNEKNPSCRLYTNEYNNLKYKDFASGDNLDCWNYVMQKFNCNYYEALNIISNDFDLNSGNVLINPRIIVINDDFIPQIKSRIEFIKQPWNITDFNFWSEYKIDFNMLDFYNVISANCVMLYKGDERFIFHYSKSKPRYGYIFKNSNKAYSPYDDKIGKWLYDGDVNNIEGWDQLDESGDVLIITKSLKDVMCYRTIGINAISLPSESSRLTIKTVVNLRTRFKRIIINMDNDKQGIIQTNKIVDEYGFNHFYIDGEKDFSDWIKFNKSLSSINMINNKINKNG